MKRINRLRQSKRLRRRNCQFEPLETRLLLTTGWQNPFTPFDVNFDGIVSPIDVLTIINKINRDGPGSLRPLGNETPVAYFDTNGDGFVAPLDALGPINRLNGDATPPRISVRLARDTAPAGSTNADGRTFDPTVTGTIRDSLGVHSLQISLDGGVPTAVDVDPTGSFTFLPSLATDGTNDGSHLLTLTSRDGRGNISTDTLTFVLDTIAPAELAWQLEESSDTVPVGDNRTDASEVVIVGSTEPDAVASVSNQPGLTMVSRDGLFELPATSLMPGDNSLTINTFDAAGNRRSLTNVITRTLDRSLVSIEENSTVVDEQSFVVTLEQVEGTRVLSFDVDAAFDRTEPQLPSSDRLLVYLLDSTSGETLLDRGVNGTALFGYDGKTADIAQGLVAFDGATVSIDVTSVKDATEGLLLFQLLSGDLATNTRIAVNSIDNVVNPEGTPAIAEIPEETLTEPGDALAELETMSASSDVRVRISNARFDSSTGFYAAEIRLVADQPVGRAVAVLFPDVPEGVTIANASGTDVGGNAYLNMSPAIDPGGLIENEPSQSVLLQINNPELKRFSLAPDVLIGEPNRPPVLDEVPHVNIMPGETHRLTVSATDPDNDPVFYTIVPGVSGAPTMSFLSADVVAITPTPAQLGEYTISVVASDGVLETEQEITISVVADPITTTRVSGVVQDTNRLPLAGVPIDMDGVSTVTDDNGRFELEYGDSPINDPTLFIHGDQLEDESVYPFIAEKLDLLFLAGYFDGVNNVLERPIYLPALDIAGGTAIDPASDTNVVQEIAPGETAAVMVKAGTLLDQQGQPFDDVLSITEVPRDLTPAALPSNLVPDTVVTIQPGEMEFMEPAPLTLPNRSGLAAGIELDLWSINPETGIFDNVGRGRVSEDGASVETIIGGVRSSSWHFFAILAATFEFENEPLNEKPQCSCESEAAVESSSRAQLHSGDLTEHHVTGVYQSLGVARGVELLYDTGGLAHDRVFHFRYPDLGGNSQSITGVSGDFRIVLDAELRILDGDTQVDFNRERTVLATASQAGRIVVPGFGRSTRFGIRGRFSNLPSGHYSAELRAGVLTLVDGQVVEDGGGFQTRRLEFLHLNSRTSPFGSGWDLRGLQQLIIQEGRPVVLVDGSSRPAAYQRNSDGSFTSPSNDFSTLSRLADGSFERRMLDQSVTNFSANGQMTSMVDRHGNSTQYEYDEDGRLKTIIDPVGLKTFFFYSNGLLESIRDPAGRLTTFEHQHRNLVAIHDPDGSTRRFQYNARGMMTGETTKRDFQESTEYIGGHVSQTVRRDGTVWKFMPAKALVQHGPVPIAMTVDGNGNTTEYTLDQAGHVTASRDEIGVIATLPRNSRNQVVAHVDGRGVTTRFAYDDRGNVTYVDDTPNETGEVFPDREYRFPLQLDTRVTVGDLNNDGRPDYAAAVPTRNTVHLLLSDEFGGFQELRELAAPSVRAVAISDLDDDGFADLVLGTASLGSSRFNVQILYGDERGEFAEESVTTNIVGATPKAIAIGDMNNDGMQDIVVGTGGCCSSGRVAVLENEGNREFTVASNLAVPEAHEIELANLDGDLNLDVIALSSSTNEVLVLAGNGDSSVAAPVGYAVGTFPRNLALGDVNSDGRVDLLTSNITTDDFSILIATDDGRFEESVSIPGVDTPTSITVGDVNGDGHADTLVSNSITGDPVVSLFIGDGSGGFAAPRHISASASLGFVQLVDDNDDGILDLLAANNGVPGGSLRIAHGDGSGEFQLAPEGIPVDSPSTLALADVNEDGLNDLITAGLDVALADPAGGFHEFNRVGITFSGTRTPNSMVVADIDGDQHFDIVNSDGQLFSGSADRVVVHYGDGTGQFSTSEHQTYRTGRSPVSVAVGDVNGDGRPDMVSGNFGSQDVSILLGLGNRMFAPQAPVALAGQPQTVALADVNHDNLADLVTTTADSQLHIFLSDGDGTFTATISRETGAGPNAASVDDLDNDGDMDVVVASAQANRLSIFLGDGAGGLDVERQVALVGSPQSIRTADVDGDERTDIVVAMSESHILIFFGDGSGNFETPSRFGAVSGPFDVVVGPVGLGTSLDVVTSYSGSNTISILERIESQSFATRSEYEPMFNQLNRYVDELGRETLFDIDPTTGDTRTITEVIGLRDSESLENDDLVTTLTYTSRGLLETATDPLGRISSFTYDYHGRLTTVTYAVGTDVEAKMSYEYDLAGNTTAMVDENGNRTEYEYDSMNRVTRIIESDPDGDGPLDSPVSGFVYDAAGNVEQATNAQGRTTYTTYDGMDRPLAVRDDQFNVMRYKYDFNGNLLRLTDPLGHATDYSYDARNRVTQTKDPDDGITRYKYDANDNLKSLTDPVGNTTRYAYDFRDRTIRETDPLEKATTYRYDPVNNLIGMTDRNDRVTTYTYDDVDRLLASTWLDPVGQIVNEIEYSYDKASNLQSIDDFFSSLSYTHDERNRVKTVDNAGTPDVPNVVLEYTYDGVGNVLSVDDTIDGTQGATTGYAYDALHRLVRLTQQGPNLSEKRVDFSYNPIGQYDVIARFADLAGTQSVITTTHQYDNIDRLIDLRHSNSTEDVAFYEYTYDSASRIETITDIVGLTTYAYDDRDQLTTAVRGDTDPRGDESYQYDANGNRTNSHRHGSNYVTGPANRLMSDGTYNYQYDDEGNMALRTEIVTGDYREFDWDHRNRLIRVTDFSSGGVITQQVDFTYDAFGRRLSKTVDTTPAVPDDETVTHFVYDREDVILDFLDSDGTGPASPTLERRYLHGPGIDQVLAQSNANTQWLLPDHLGSIHAVTDASGVAINQIQYDAYGNAVTVSIPSASSRYLFTGREWDEETGLYYFRARMVNPLIGQFIAEDPIRFASDSNIRRYALNHPNQRIDTTGLDSESVSYSPSVLLEQHSLSLQANLQLKAQLLELERTADQLEKDFQSLLRQIQIEKAQSTISWGGIVTGLIAAGTCGFGSLPSCGIALATFCGANIDTIADVWHIQRDHPANALSNTQFAKYELMKDMTSQHRRSLNRRLKEVESDIVVDEAMILFYRGQLAY